MIYLEKGLSTKENHKGNTNLKGISIYYSEFSTEPKCINFA